MSASKGGLTVSSNGGLTVTGQKRDLMIQAAMAYDETQKHIADLENKLNLALAALEAKNSEIDNLNLLLSQERNRNDNHRNERDQAYAERAEVLAILCNVRAMLEKTETPLHLRRKRNGNVVADNGSGQVVIEGGGRSSAKPLANADTTSQAEVVS